MRVGGFDPCSFSDYPGHPSCVVFAQGCPWRCEYCHNKTLLSKNGKNELTLDYVQKELSKVKDQGIDHCVVSGGEPLFQYETIEFIKGLSSNFAVKLDTNGRYPDRLRACLPYLSFIAMDIKTVWGNYRRLFKIGPHLKEVKESVKVIKESGIPYQFRCTWDKDLISEVGITQLKKEFPNLKVQVCNK